MPELAEVELAKRSLEKFSLNQKIVKVETDGNERFIQAENSLNERVISLRRRGKYIIFELTNDLEMIIHLGMTGSVLASEESKKLTRFRARWFFENEEVITLTDFRGFGRVEVTKKGNYENLKGLQNLGPEPLDNFIEKPFIEGFKKVGSPVKSRLLNQKYMAGPGNYVCDESLWRSKINPHQKFLTEKEAKLLIKNLKDVFIEGINNGGLSLKDYVLIDGSKGNVLNTLDCYNRNGLPCNRCGTLLTKTTIAGRGSTWCPKCQKEKKVKKK